MPTKITEDRVPAIVVANRGTHNYPIGTIGFSAATGDGQFHMMASPIGQKFLLDQTHKLSTSDIVLATKEGAKLKEYIDKQQAQVNDLKKIYETGHLPMSDDLLKLAKELSDKVVAGESFTSEVYRLAGAVTS